MKWLRGPYFVDPCPRVAAYTDTIVEQRSFHSLDTCEDKWRHKLDAKINIQIMILGVKTSCTFLRCFKPFCVI